MHTGVYAANFEKWRDSSLEKTSKQMQWFISRFLFAVGFKSASKSFDGFDKCERLEIGFFEYSVWWRKNLTGFTVNVSRNGMAVSFLGDYFGDWNRRFSNNEIELFRGKDIENLEFLAMRNGWPDVHSTIVTECAMLADKFIETWIPDAKWKNRVCMCQSALHGNLHESLHPALCDYSHGRYVCGNCAAHLDLTSKSIPNEPAKNKSERDKLSDRLRWRILEKYNFTCQSCGRQAPKDGVKLHVDHKVPIALGGKTVEDNLHVLCQDCNLGKSDAMPKHKTLELWGVNAG